MGIRKIQSPWLSDVVSTTDATPTVSTACSYVVPSGSFGYVDMNLILKASATVAVASVRVPFRNVAGTLTLLTAINLSALGGDAGLLTAALDATTSGTTIQPRVTGIVATSLEWQLDCRYSVD